MNETLQKISARGLALLVMFASASACSRHPERPSPAPRASATALPDVFAEYPRGSWRTDPSLLSGVVVSLAEIVVAHDASEIDPSKPWAAKQVPHRSRDEARALAGRVASAVRWKPGEFEAMAHRYSDEPESAARGGVAGVFRASELPTLVVDAYATLASGEISRVIEDEYGFHVIRRLSVPPEVTRGYDEIVIEYTDAIDHPLTVLGRHVTRTRTEAAGLAEQVASEARARPEAFGELVAKYSDGFSANAAGYGGTWSSHGGSQSKIFAAMAEVKDGDIAAPVEGVGCFRIVRPKPPAVGAWVRTEEIVVKDADSLLAVGDLASRRTSIEARAIARRIIAALKRSPAEFNALDRRYCDQQRCKGTIHPWREGHGIPVLDQAVAALSVGELADAPIETPLGVHVVRRVEAPAPPVPAAPTFEIPNPGPRDVDFFFDRAPSVVLASATRAFKGEAVRALALPPEKADTFAKILDDLAASIEREPVDKRPQIREAVKSELTGLLGADGYTKYCEVRDVWVRSEQARL